MATMVLVALTAILLYSIPSAVGSKMKLVPIKTKTYYKNGSIHETIKYTMVPHNDNSAENDLNIPADSVYSNNDNSQNLHKFRTFKNDGKNIKHDQKIYMNPGAVYYTKSINHNDGTDGSYNPNIKNINDKKHKIVKTKNSVVRYHVTYKTSPEITGLLNGDDNIIGNNYGKTSIVDQEDFNSGKSINTVPLPSQWLKTYNSLQNLIPSEDEENSYISKNGNPNLEGTVSQNLKNSELITHDINLPDNQVKKYHWSFKSQPNVFPNIAVPTNDKLPNNVGQMHVQKTVIPKNTINSYHWTFKNQPNGDFANFKNTDVPGNGVLPNNDGQINMQNIALPGKTVTHGWTYNIQPNDGISSMNHITVPNNYVPLMNDGQMNVEKMVPGNTLKMYHWYGNQPDGKIANINNIDVPVNDVLPKNNGEMNMKNLALPVETVTHDWPYDTQPNEVISKMINMGVPINNLPLENNGQINMEKTVPGNTVHTYHWTLEKNPNRELANVQNMNVPVNDVQMNMQNLALPVETVTGRWTYGIQANDVISSMKHITVPTNNVPLINDGQMNVEKTVPGNIVKTYHWSYGTQPNGEVANINNVDVPANYVLPKYNGEMNMQNLALPVETVTYDHIEPNDVRTNMLNINVPVDNLPLKNDSQINMEKNIPSNIVKTYHWTLEKNPNGELRNIQNVDVNDVLPENNVQINKQKIVLPKKTKITHEWTLSTQPNVDISNIQDITESVNDLILEKNSSPGNFKETVPVDTVRTDNWSLENPYGDYTESIDMPVNDALPEKNDDLVPGIPLSSDNKSTDEYSDIVSSTAPVSWDLLEGTSQLNMPKVIQLSDKRPINISNINDIIVLKNVSSAEDDSPVTIESVTDDDDIETSTVKNIDDIVVNENVRSEDDGPMAIENVTEDDDIKTSTVRNINDTIVLKNVRSKDVGPVTIESVTKDTDIKTSTGRNINNSFDLLNVSSVEDHGLGTIESVTEADNIKTSTVKNIDDIIVHENVRSEDDGPVAIENVTADDDIKTSTVRNINDPIVLKNVSSEDDGPVAIESITGDNDIKTSTVRNEDVSSESIEDITVDEPVNNNVFVSVDQEVPEKVSNKLSTSTIVYTEEPSAFRENVENIVSEETISPDIWTDVFIAETTQSPQSAESVDSAVITSTEELSPKIDEKLELSTTVPEDDIIVSSEENVDTSKPTLITYINSGIDNPIANPDLSDESSDKINGSSEISNAPDSLIIDAADVNVITQKPADSSENINLNSDEQNTLPESNEESNEMGNNSENTVTFEPNWDQEDITGSSDTLDNNDVQDVIEGSENFNLLADNINPEELVISNDDNSEVKDKKISELRDGNDVTEKTQSLLPKLSPCGTNYNIKNRGFNYQPNINYVVFNMPLKIEKNSKTMRQDADRIGEYYTDAEYTEYDNTKPKPLDDYEIPYATVQDVAAAGLERDNPYVNRILNRMDDYKLIKERLLVQPASPNIIHNNYYKNGLSLDWPYAAVDQNMYLEPLHGTYRIPMSSLYYWLLLNSYPSLGHLLHRDQSNGYIYNYGPANSLDSYKPINNDKVLKYIPNTKSRNTGDRIENVQKLVATKILDVKSYIVDTSKASDPVNDLEMMLINGIDFGYDNNIEINWAQRVAIESKYKLENLKQLFLNIIIFKKRDITVISNIKKMYKNILKYLWYLEITGFSKSEINKKIRKIEKYIYRIVTEVSKPKSPYASVSKNCWYCK